MSIPSVIYSDNIGATYLCANRVSHVASVDQLADALTKALPRPHLR